MPWLLVVGGQVQGSRLCVRGEGNCATHNFLHPGRLGWWWSAVRSRAAGYEGNCATYNFPQPGRIACCPTPDSRPPVTKALHTIYGNNTIIFSSSWWWAYKCPKHVDQIISAVNQSVASSWFSSLRTFKQVRADFVQIHLTSSFKTVTMAYLMWPALCILIKY